MFVLPVILSLIFGSTVLAEVLQKPDRELNMWPMTFTEGPSEDTEIKIIGLSKQYSTSEPIEIKVGDLAAFLPTNAAKSPTVISPES